MNLRKTFFILPNLFTLGSVFCGLFAITTVCDHPTIDGLYQAAIAVCFALFFDLTDGRVARLTKTQSSLGRELDSLADVISFGVVPALIVYRWGLSRFGKLGLVIAFTFTAAGALRLARFNVLSMQEDKPGKFIIGLPVPVAASVLVSLVILNHQLSGSFVDVGQGSLALVVLVLSYLMVSRIRFRSFKDLKILSRRAVVAVLVLAALTAAAFAAKMQSAFLFVALLAAYLGLGLGEEVIFFRRRRAEEQSGHGITVSQQIAAEPAEGGARSDEEVLAELGAFDREEEESDEGS